MGSYLMLQTIRLREIVLVEEHQVINRLVFTLEMNAVHT